MHDPIDVAKFLSDLADDNLLAAELREASINHVNATISACQVVRELDLHKKDLEINLADALEEIEEAHGLSAQERRETIRYVLRDLAEDTVLSTDIYRTRVAEITNRLREVDEANREFWQERGVPSPAASDFESDEVPADLKPEPAPLLDQLVARAVVVLLECHLRGLSPLNDGDRYEAELRATFAQVRGVVDLDRFDATERHLKDGDA